MRKIIVRMGNLGEYLARGLVKDKNKVILVDIDFKISRDIIDNEDTNHIYGNGLVSNVL